MLASDLKRGFIVIASIDSLEAAFNALATALATGDLDSFYGVMADDAVIMDEDSPFPNNKAEFQHHIAFHTSGTWENFAWMPRDMRFRVLGNTGVAIGYSVFRGKPTDAGYRIRPMMFSQGWAFDGSNWKLISWHQSPIIGHVTDQSPA
jgi:ketosteroid isomerase-like protein